MDLGGSFHRSFEENTEGYSVLVTEYEILEKEKYFERHHLTTSNQSVADPYQYIMEVTIKIRNQNNESGNFNKSYRIKLHQITVYARKLETSSTTV